MRAPAALLAELASLTADELVADTYGESGRRFGIDVRLDRRHASDVGVELAYRRRSGRCNEGTGAGLFGAMGRRLRPNTGPTFGRGTAKP